MNDFERRMLDVLQASDWMRSITRKDQKILSIESYTYNVEIAAVAIGANGQGTAQIQSDSDFALTYISGAVIIGGALVTGPNATLQITDTGTGKTFFSAPTLFELVVGAGGSPFYLPAPRVIAPNTNVQVNVSAVAGAGAMTFYLALYGMRIYYAG